MATRDEETAWLAGVFEGEGCIAFANGRLVLRMNNTDRSVVARFWSLMDEGTIYGPYQGKGRRKPFWVWHAAGQDALDALQRLSPWLSTRRLDRAEEITGIRFPVKWEELA